MQSPIIQCECGHKFPYSLANTVPPRCPQCKRFKSHLYWKQVRELEAMFMPDKKEIRKEASL